MAAVMTECNEVCGQTLRSAGMIIREWQLSVVKIVQARGKFTTDSKEGRQNVADSLLAGQALTVTYAEC
jgi:hypothetical protein